MLDKALQTISYREEKERTNIWVARLNLEISFGQPETLMTVFQDSTRAYVILWQSYFILLCFFPLFTPSPC